MRAVRDDAEGPGQATVHLLAAADPANPYGAALAWPRRGEDDRRPLQRAAGAYVVLVDGVATLYLERGGSTLQTLPAFDDPAVATVAVRGLASLVRSGRFRELVVRKADGEDIATAPARAALLEAGFVAGYRGLTLRAERWRSATMPEGDTLFRTAAGLRPFLVGRDVTAAHVQGPGAVPQIHRVVGQRIDAVEAHGKNLLIRFDGGLELRTHLRMQGSWHRYRPGERWRRPPARARLVLEVPGSVAVCFDALVVELFEQRAESLHGALSRLGPDLLDPAFDADEALRRMREPSRAALDVAVALLDQRALAGIGNVIKNEVLWIDRVSVRPCATSTMRRWRASSRPPDACCWPTSTRDVDPNGSRPRATGALPDRCTSTAGVAGRAVLSHADPRGPAGHGPAQIHVLVSDLPGRGPGR